MCVRALVRPLHAVDNVVSLWLLVDDMEQLSLKVGDMGVGRRYSIRECLARAGVAFAHQIVTLKCSFVGLTSLDEPCFLGV